MSNSKNTDALAAVPEYPGYTGTQVESLPAVLKLRPTQSTTTSSTTVTRQISRPRRIPASGGTRIPRVPLPHRAASPA
eukprot:2608687-Rhodomonas_salina.1